MTRSRKQTSPAYECVSSWEAIHAEPPATLFHYTTAEGLLGIMETRGLWATHMRFLNDFTELSYGAQMVETELERFVKSRPRVGEVTQTAFEEVRHWLQAMLDDCKAKTKHFIVCFCENDDLLSQWRGYASVGGGFALGFKSDRLLDFYSDRRKSRGRSRDPDHDPRTLVMLRRVVYREAQQRRIVRDALGAIWQACLKAKNEQSPDLWSDFEHVQRLLYECAACFKDSRFGEEREWRLVQQARVGNEDVCQEGVRVRSGRLVSYSNLRFRSGTKGTNALPIVSITFGPTLKREDTERVLRLLIEQNGLDPDAVATAASRIPFTG